MTDNMALFFDSISITNSGMASMSATTKLRPALGFRMGLTLRALGMTVSLAAPFIKTGWNQNPGHRSGCSMRPYWPSDWTCLGGPLHVRCTVKAIEIPGGHEERNREGNAGYRILFSSCPRFVGVLLPTYLPHVLIYLNASLQPRLHTLGAEIHPRFKIQCLQRPAGIIIRRN